MLARASTPDKILDMPSTTAPPDEPDDAMPERKDEDPEKPKHPEISASDAARALGRRGASKGGKERAKKLDAAQRAEIAKAGAEARWGLPKAFKEAPLKIGDVTFQAAILEDRSTRLMSEASFMEAMGFYYSGWVSTNREQQDDGAQLPLHLSFEKLKPFIPNHLQPADLQPVKYRTLSGNIAHGIPAETVPKICRVWVDAANAGGLGKRQLQIAEQAAVLLRGLENVGIVALLDEAIGFQEHRDSDALSKILEQFISKELAEWVKTFDDDFYSEIHRVKGWKQPSGTARNHHIGTLTNELVYDRLAPGVLDQLQSQVLRDAKGRLKTHLHRSLTRHTGYQALKTHLRVVVALMQITPTGKWDMFIEHLDKVRPSFRMTTKALPFPDPETN